MKAHDLWILQCRASDHIRRYVAFAFFKYAVYSLVYIFTRTTNRKGKNSELPPSAGISSRVQGTC